MRTSGSGHSLTVILNTMLRHGQKWAPALEPAAAAAAAVT